ncbi:MAG: hypothetical protein BGN99_07735 [Alphaproteobacteria bacterium 65-37]|nr:MAG: hypothetical protein BGN99_07735 [Alphaproteobacteria bacterium 65-37]
MHARQALEAKDAEAGLTAGAPFPGDSEQHGRRTADPGVVIARVDVDPCCAAGIQGWQTKRIFRIGQFSICGASPQGTRRGEGESKSMTLHVST